MLIGEVHKRTGVVLGTREYQHINLNPTLGVEY